MICDITGCIPWKGIFGGHLVSAPLLKQVTQTRLLRAAFTQVLNLLRDGDCIPSLGCPRHEEEADITIINISDSVFLTCGNIETSFSLSAHA